MLKKHMLYLGNEVLLPYSLSNEQTDLQSKGDIPKHQRTDFGIASQYCLNLISDF